MKTAYVVGLVLFCTTSLWAGLGETKAEVLKKYGTPTTDDERHLVLKFYSTEPYFVITFFTNKVGTCVSGKISYVVPSEFSSLHFPEKFVFKILEVHAGGQKWIDTTPKEDMNESHTFSREGYSAKWYFGRDNYFVSVWLDEYSADKLDKLAERKKLSAKKSNALLDNLK